jgi:FtsZ-binding cell division protein ZapB
MKAAMHDFYAQPDLRDYPDDWFAFMRQRDIAAGIPETPARKRQIWQYYRNHGKIYMLRLQLRHLASRFLDQKRQYECLKERHEAFLSIPEVETLVEKVDSAMDTSDLLQTSVVDDDDGCASEDVLQLRNERATRALDEQQRRNAELETVLQHTQQRVRALEDTIAQSCREVEELELMQQHITGQKSRFQSHVFTRVWMSAHWQWTNALRVVISEFFCSLPSGHALPRGESWTLRNAASYMAKHSNLFFSRGLLSISHSLAHDHPISGWLYLALLEVIRKQPGLDSVLARLLRDMMESFCSQGMEKEVLLPSRHVSLTTEPIELNTDSIQIFSFDWFGVGSARWGRGEKLLWVCRSCAHYRYQAGAPIWEKFTRTTSFPPRWYRMEAGMQRSVMQGAPPGAAVDRPFTFGPLCELYNELCSNCQLSKALFPVVMRDEGSLCFLVPNVD